MKRLVAGAAAFALAGIGSVGLASPLAAQSVEVHWDLTELDWNDVRVRAVELDGDLSPAAAAPGEIITVTSECNLQQMSDPVHAHEIRWALIEAGTFMGWDDLPDKGEISFEAIQEGRVDVPGQGEENEYIWEVQFEAPAEAGEYEFVAICAPIHLADYPHCDIGLYGPTDLSLEVEEDDEEEEDEEEPPAAPPAPPVVGEPPFTG